MIKDEYNDMTNWNTMTTFLFLGICYSLIPDHSGPEQRNGYIYVCIFILNRNGNQPVNLNMLASTSANY